MRIIALVFLLSASALYAQDPSQRVCGNEYASAGVAGLTYAEALDYTGRLHDEYQEELLGKLLAEDVYLKDVERIEEIMERNTTEFFATRGIDISGHHYQFCFSPCRKTLGIVPGRQSEEATAILTELERLILSYDGLDDARFLSALEELKAAALQLPEEQDVFMAGIPVTIAIHSFQYWQANADRWLEALTAEVEAPAARRPRMIQTNKKCKVSLVSAGLSDAGGAYAVGSLGVFAGPVGVVAGGLLGAGAGSAGNLIGQGIACAFGWL
ncbi:MAG TPA: hypothetical protein VF432_04020 [Thermoanaerobaculia bacterium]